MYIGADPEPEATSVTVAPAHKLKLPGDITTLGVGLTVTDTVVLDVVPQASMAITVYVVVPTGGFTVAVVPVIMPTKPGAEKLLMVTVQAPNKLLVVYVCNFIVSPTATVIDCVPLCEIPAAVL